MSFDSIRVTFSISKLMLIGLISDTHIDSPSKKLPPQLKDVFKGVDLILHAGDIWIPSVLDELETIAPVKAAWGDDDLEEKLGGDSRMMNGHALSFNSTTLWLMHEKPRYGLVNLEGELHHRPKLDPGTPTEPEDPEEHEPPPDIVVFGHTHQAAIERYQGVMLVNPGSVNLPHFILQLGTVGLLTIDSGKIEARIVQLK